MSIFHDNALLGSSDQSSTCQISRSLRFNSADSAYLSRTPAQAGNRKTWTWAGWVKRSALDAGSFHALFTCTPASSVNDSNCFALEYRSETIAVSGGVTNWKQSIQVFRDFSSWYHLVLAVDTTQSTANNRIRVYVNGNEITFWTINNSPTQNADLGVNQNISHSIGSIQPLSTRYVNAYLADIYFIDGQALTPTSFGQTDINGIWQPKAYTGTYGTNGFHLDFADNSAATAAALGKDTSGNGNNWTPNNLSVTAGAGNDSLVDTPTNHGTDTGAGGEVRGNYCTWNPLKISSGYSLSDGNLRATGTASAYLGAVATFGISSGKWYFEVLVQTHASSNHAIGLTSASASTADGYAGSTATNGWSWVTSTGTNGVVEGSSNITVNNTPTTFTSGDILQVAFDADAGKVWLGKNGAWTASGNPAAGTNQTITYTTSEAPYFPVTRPYNGSVNIANFGQRSFSYAAPSGFKSLCTQNLSSTTITTSGSYTGNGSADGPVVWLNGVPLTMTVNGNAVTFGTHADKLASGFKLRTTSTTYNQNASTYNYSVTSTGDPFLRARAQSN